MLNDNTKTVYNMVKRFADGCILDKLDLRDIIGFMSISNIVKFDSSYIDNYQYNLNIFISYTDIDYIFDNESYMILYEQIRKSLILVSDKKLYGEYDNFNTISYSFDDFIIICSYTNINGVIEQVTEWCRLLQ